MSQASVRTEPAPSANQQRQQDAAALVALSELGEAVRDLSFAINMRPELRGGRIAMTAMAIERAAGRLRRGVLAEAVASDVASDPEAALRQVAFELHTAAEGPAVLAGVVALREAASRAMIRFREYEAHHRAKPDQTKAARNAASAGDLERALFPRLTDEPDARARLAPLLRALIAGDAKAVHVKDLTMMKEVAEAHDLKGMADFIGGLIVRKLGDE